MRLDGWDKFQVLLGAWIALNGAVAWFGGRTVFGPLSVATGLAMIAVPVVEARRRARRVVDDEA